MKLIYKIFLLLLPLVMFAKEATVEQLFSVQTVKVKKDSKSIKIKNYGYVTVDESKKYDVVPRFGGYVISLHVDTKYFKVKKGDPLVTVYSPKVFKAKEEYLNAYKYNQKRANAGMLNSAKLKLKLLGVSDKEISKIIKNKKAKTNITIYSPVNGYVFSKSINQGSAFNEKQKLFEIVNLDKVWVESKIFQEQIQDIKSAELYEISFKGIKQTYIAKQKLLYPEIDPKIATLTLRLHVDNVSNKLFPGMYASINSVKTKKERLVLPATAVIRKNAKYFVFMVGEYEGEYEPREIAVKVLDAKTYEVISGLKDGDEVVNNALFMMDSDAQINSLY